jgi:septin family protein
LPHITRPFSHPIPSPSLTFPGESGLGKSTLINTLFETKLYGPKSVPQPGQDRGKTVQIESTIWTDSDAIA